MDSEYTNLQHRLTHFEEQRGNFIFKLNYKDPEPGFDHRKVKGRVFSNFQIKDPYYMKALEAGAGIEYSKIKKIKVDIFVFRRKIDERRP